MQVTRNLIAGLLAAASVAVSAHAQTDPLVMQSENYSGVPYYGGNDGEDSIFYVPCWVPTNGGTHLRINSVTMGLFQAAAAPTVDVEMTVAEMTNTSPWNGGGSGSAAYAVRGAVKATGTGTIPENTDTTNAYIYTMTWTFGDTDPSVRPVVNLCMTPNGPNGYGGYWVGLRFMGPNSGDGSTYGYILTNEPSIGDAFNRFGIYTPSSSSMACFYWYGTETNSDGVTREVPCHFYVDVAGLVTDAGSVPADYKYGQLCLTTRESGSYWKPYDSAGAAYSVYINNFVAATAGQVLKPTQVTLGVYRGGSPTAAVPAVGVELALCAMTWDGTNYGVGSTIASQTINLPSSNVGMTTSYAVWNIPANSVTVPLNTDNAANAGFGGYWVRARMVGGNSADSQGFEIGYAPVVGASFNAIGIMDSTQTPPVLQYYGFGQYSSEIYDSAGNVIGYRNLPARQLNTVHGTVGSAAPPCPADLNHDGVVNGADLGLLLGSWGPCSGCAADLNADGVVNGADLGLMLGSWGACPH